MKLVEEMDLKKIKQLITGPEGNSKFCFSRLSIFPEGPVLICSITGNFEAGNSLNLPVMVVVGQHLRVSVHCYPLMS